MAECRECKYYEKVPKKRHGYCRKPYGYYEGLKVTGAKKQQIDVLRKEVLTMADLIEREPLLAKMWPNGNKRLVEEAPAVNLWIPVEDALPDALQNVLVCTDINTITIAWINGDGWTFADTGNGHTEKWSFEDVKFWMPLPEPPKGDRK